MLRFSILLLPCLGPFFCGAQSGPGDQFFGPATVHEIRFQFHQQGYFDSLKANYPLDAYMRCDVTIDGQPYPVSGVKYKGNSSYNNPGKKKPFRIDLEEYVNDREHDGMKKFVLNNGFKDPTLLREKLMLDFLNERGIIAPRASFARLYINDRYWGLYSVVEDVNKTFLDDRFGNKNGNLFKGDPNGRLEWKGWDQNLYQSNYELKTNETENNWTDLVRLINALNNTPNAALPDSLARYMNLDGWYDYWATHNLFVNLDSYIGSGHNYFVYHDTDTDRFEWITWDVNEAFGNFQMGLSLSALKTLPYNHIPQPPQGRPMMNKCLNNALLLKEYLDHYCNLLPYFNNAMLDPKIDALAALIRPHVYADTLKFFSNARFEENLSTDINVPGTPGGSNIAGLKSFITARRNYLTTQLAAQGCMVSATDEQAESQNIFIYPNPALDILHIEIKDVAQAELIDTRGSILHTYSFAGHETISLSDHPSGVYILRFIQKNAIRSYKICKP